MYEFLDEVPRKYHKVDFSREGGYEEPEVKREEVPLKLANVISSLGTDGLHYPVLDLDIPAYLVPSSTPGHSHLYLNIEIDADTYFELLDVLSGAGILESGYVAASEARGYSSVRLPWVKKDEGGDEGRNDLPVPAQGSALVVVSPQPWEMS